MGITIENSALGRLADRGSIAADEVAAQVRSLLSGVYPEGRVVERRAAPRYPYPRLIVLMPIDESGAPTHESIVACGKQLSETGIGIFHKDPLPFRRAIASFERTDGGWVGFIVDLSWCRFTRHGWYESGGRFLEIVPSPLAADA